LILNVQQEKEKINEYISVGVQEILHKGLRIADNNLGNLEDDINLFMRALQLKNKIFDFACILKYDYLFKRFEGKIVYDLIDSDEDQYSEEITFYF
jgi:hypothetical protein